MFRHDELLQSSEAGGGRFEHEKRFSSALFLALPPVVRLDLRHQVGAGDEVSIQRRGRQASRGLQIRCGNQNDAKAF